VTEGNMFRPAGTYLCASSPSHSVAALNPQTLAFVPGGGLGFVLEEVASSASAGITCVSELVPGSPAAATGIEPGDCLTSISCGGRAVSLEALGYDATIEALTGLIGGLSAPAELTVTASRLQRTPMVNVTLISPFDPPQTLSMPAGSNLRRTLLVRGFKLNDALAERFDSGGTGDCGAEGTCATCAVSVQRGMELLSPAGLQEQQIFQNNPRWRMACKVVVGHGGKEGELVVRLSPRQS
jgi:ferredoxin